jgi:hypothetical protein
MMLLSLRVVPSAAGSAGVYFWDTLFQQAAAEGISVFVFSGDSGATSQRESSSTLLMLYANTMPIRDRLYCLPSVSRLTNVLHSWDTGKYLHTLSAVAAHHCPKV